jgi:hypothetical protein
LAAPADFIASVIKPSLMFPGEGFISNPEPASTTDFSKAFIKDKNLSAFSSSTHRFINSCSTPHNSGNSAKLFFLPRLQKYLKQLLKKD